MQSTKTFSGYQLFWLMFLYNVGMATIIMAGPTIKEARQDAWISEVLVGVISLAVTYVSIRVTKLFPGLSFVEVSRKLLGKWFGNVFLLLYLMEWSTVTGIGVRQVVDYIILTQYSRTPMFVMVLFTVLVTFYMTHAGGMESIGRVGNVLGPLTLVFLAVIDLLSIPNARFERLTPVDLTGQWQSVIIGSTPSASFVAHSMIVLVLVPFLRPGHAKAPRGALWGVAAAALFLTLNVLMIVAVLGPVLPARQLYPLTAMTSFISIAEFLQNIELLLVMVLFFSAIVRFSVYQFAAAHCWAEFLGIKNWKLANLVLSVVTLVVAIIPSNATQVATDYTSKIVEPIVYPYLLIGGPLLLFVAGLFRRAMSPS